MIYQILFVFALLVVALNSEKVPKLTKKAVEKTNEDYKEPIEWGFMPSWTVGLPKGTYSAWKKDGEEWKLFTTIKIDEGQRVKLCPYKGFEWSGTYVIYGRAHKDMKFEKSGEISNEVDLNEIKLMKSSEKCFKSHLIIFMLIVVAVTLAACGSGVFGCWYFKIKQECSDVVIDDIVVEDVVIAECGAVVEGQKGTK